MPADQIALTFDIHGRNPLTVSISVTSLVGMLDSVGALVAGRTYEQVLHLLGAVIEAADAGNGDAGLIGYWLALNHPAGGAEMVARLSDEIAINGRAHLTLHASRDRGIAIALGAQFVDLDQVAASAREAGVATYVAAEPRRQRPGGMA